MIIDTTPTIELAAALLADPGSLAVALDVIREERPLPAGTEVERIDFGIERALVQLGATGEVFDLPALRLALGALPGKDPARVHADAIVSRVHASYVDRVDGAPGLVLRLARRVVEMRIARRMRATALDSWLSPHQIATRVGDLGRTLPSPMEDRRRAARVAWLATLDALVSPVPTRRYVPTGITQLDGYFRGGLGERELTVFALGTNAGKSLLAATIARNVQWPVSARRVPASMASARLKVPRPGVNVGNDVDNDELGDCYALLVSLEDPADSITHRWCLDLVDVDTAELDEPARRRALLISEAFAGRRALLDTVVETLRSDDARIEVVDAEMLGGELGSSCQLDDIVAYVTAWAVDIRQRCAAAGRPEPRLLALVDYIQYVELPTDDRRERIGQLQHITRTFGRLAKHERLAVACTAMVNGRIGADVATTDIREAKDIEHGAHVIVTVDCAQGWGDQLTIAVQAEEARIAAAAFGDDNQTVVLQRRHRLAGVCHTARIHKTRTTGGRGRCVTWHTQWDRQRITNLAGNPDAAPSDSNEVRTVRDLDDNVIGWARTLVRQHQQQAFQERPPARRKRKAPVGDLGD